MGKGGLCGTALPTPPPTHTRGSSGQSRGREATQGRTWLPAACTAGADLNPLPESAGTLSASAERTRGCLGFWERLGRRAELARLLMPRKEGARRGRQSRLGREGPGQLGPELV